MIEHINYLPYRHTTQRMAQIRRSGCLPFSEFSFHGERSTPHSGHHQPATSYDASCLFVTITNLRLKYCIRKTLATMVALLRVRSWIAGAPHCPRMMCTPENDGALVRRGGISSG
jgi:hypothetical protein